MKALAQTLDELFVTISKKEKIPSTLDTFDIVKDRYKFIKRPDGKLLNSQDMIAFTTLLLFLEKKEQLLVTYEWLEDKFRKSQRTVRRILQNLSSCFNYKFHNLITIEGKKYYNKILITPTRQLQNILADSYGELEKSKYKKPYVKYFPNPYKITDTNQQCPLGGAKVSTPIYSNKRKQEKEITTTELESTNARAREETEQKNEIINQKTLVVAQLKEPPKVFCTEPSEPKSKIVKFMAKEENPTGFATASGSLQSQVANPKTFATSNVITLSKPDDPSLTKLHSEICKSFGSLSGPSLVKQIKFIVLGEKKIGITMNNINLSDEEKDSLRTCIKSVYGEDTKIVALGAKNTNSPPEQKELPLLEKPLANANQPSNEGRGQVVSPPPEKPIIPDKSPLLPSDIWGLIRKKMIDRFREGKFIDINWLSKLDAKVDDISKKLTLKAPNSFTKDYVYQNYLSYIEEIAAKNNFAVGLGCGNEKIYYSKPSN